MRSNLRGIVSAAIRAVGRPAAAAGMGQLEELQDALDQFGRSKRKGKIKPIQDPCAFDCRKNAFFQQVTPDACSDCREREARKDAQPGAGYGADCAYETRPWGDCELCCNMSTIKVCSGTVDKSNCASSKFGPGPASLFSL